MTRYPCPTPNKCGVTWHKDPRNCYGSGRTIPAGKVPQVPEPLYVRPESREEDIFTEQGGTVARSFYPNNQIEFERWMTPSGYHREGGPAVQEWWKSGGVRSLRWLLNNKLHREDGPADISWDLEGRMTSYAWYYAGKVHCEEGPARKFWDKEGNLIREEYWIRGERYSEEDFQTYRAARDSGAPHEWAVEFVKGQNA